MKTCPKCGELNGENSRECYKCKSSLGATSSYRKICPKCKTIYAGRAESCETCGGKLSVYMDEYVARQDSSSGGCWLYVVSILIPLVGIILGCIYIARREDELGKSLIMTSIITWVVVGVISVAFASCRML